MGMSICIKRIFKTVKKGVLLNALTVKKGVLLDKNTMKYPLTVKKGVLLNALTVKKGVLLDKKMVKKIEKYTSTPFLTVASRPLFF